MKFNHGAFVDELRRRRKVIPADLYVDLMAALEYGLGNKVYPPVRSKQEPAWLLEARRHIGLKEIPGAKHNSVILGWIAKLGGWFTDDETPWCGTFVGHCMSVAGQPLPKHWYRAKAWNEWGKDVPLRVGSVVVFGRAGGGHVGFAVGESGRHLYVLGGNQGNQVNIMPIAKERLIGVRWPVNVAVTDKRLPLMRGGTASRNEA